MKYPKNYRVRARLQCEKDPEHLDLLLVGTPLPVDIIAPLTVCGCCQGAIMLVEHEDLILAKPSELKDPPKEDVAEGEPEA